jgi:hypothetical protein
VSFYNKFGLLDAHVALKAILVAASIILATTPRDMSWPAVPNFSDPPVWINISTTDYVDVQCLCNSTCYTEGQRQRSCRSDVYLRCLKSANA